MDHVVAFVSIRELGKVASECILQLMLLCCQEGKWGEVPDVHLFLPLQNNDKAWKECGLMTADSHALALEK